MTTNSKHLPPEALNDWLAAAAPALGLRAEDVPIDQVLRLAADVAHGVARPAAPLTTFLLGLALGSSVTAGTQTSATAGTPTPAADFEALAARLTDLAADWEEPRQS